MRKSKVLIIDKDHLTRQAVITVLNQMDEVEVLGTSNEIDKAEDIIHKTNPDVVLMGLDAASEDGLIIFNTIRVRYPKLPILVLSDRTETGAKAAMHALIRGAVDFVSKPEHNESILFASNHLEKRLKPAVNAALQLKDLETKLFSATKTPSTDQAPLEELFAKNDIPGISIKCIVIGGCIGGPYALFTILPNLPENLNVPIVVTQHLPKIYTGQLAEHLNAKSKIRVKEAYSNATLIPDTIWIAPGGYHTEVVRESNRSYLKIHRGPRVHKSRPSIDILFKSAANYYGRETLGILLSGCGADGLEGARRIRETGGIILVQDPRNALAPGLPLTVIKENLANAYYAADELASKIVKVVKGKEEAPIPNKGKYPAAVLWNG